MGKLLEDIFPVWSGLLSLPQGHVKLQMVFSIAVDHQQNSSSPNTNQRLDRPTRYIQRTISASLICIVLSIRVKDAICNQSTNGQSPLALHLPSSDHRSSAKKHTQMSYYITSPDLTFVSKKACKCTWLLWIPSVLIAYIIKRQASSTLRSTTAVKNEFQKKRAWANPTNPLSF